MTAKWEKHVIEKRQCAVICDVCGKESKNPYSFETEFYREAAHFNWTQHCRWENELIEDKCMDFCPDCAIWAFHALKELKRDPS